MKYFFSLLLIVLFNQSSFSTTNWQNYSTAGYIYDIAAQGSYIWATSIGGLIRVDQSTNTSTIFTSANSGLLANSTEFVKADSSGRIWVSYNNVGGVSSFDGVNWTYYNTLPNGRILGSIKKMKIDRYNRFWCLFLCTSQNIVQDRGLAMFDQSNWTIYDTTIIPQIWLGNDFDIDTAANIWFSSYYGIFKFDGVTSTVYDTSNSILDNNGATFISVDKNNVVWIGTDKIYSFSNGTWIEYTDPLSLIAAQSYKIYIDQNQNKYFYWPTNGVVKYNDTTWTLLPSSATRIPKIRALAIDDFGHIWSGAFASGGAQLSEYNGSTLQNHQINNSPIDNNYGLGVEIDSAENKWFLTEYSVFKFDGINFTNVTPTTQITSFFNDILIDKQQHVWVGGYDSDMITSDLQMYDGNNWTAFPFQKISDIEMDSTGNVWFIGEGTGLVKYDGSNFTTYDLSTMDPNNDPYSLTIDLSQRIWIACTNMVLIFDGINNWTILNNSNAPMDFTNYTVTLKADENGFVWIPSVNGCYKTDGINWNYYATGWISWSFLFRLITDDQNILWLATNQGLKKFNGTGFETYSLDSNRTGSSYIKDIEIDANGNAWIAAFDGGFSVWNQSGIIDLVHVPPSNIEGSVYFDSNVNGLYDSTEYKLPYQSTMLLPDSDFCLTSMNGVYKYYKDTGSYHVTYTPVIPWVLSSNPSSYNISTQLGNNCCYDFGTRPLVVQDRAEIDLGYNILRCSTEQIIWLTTRNTGTTIFDGKVYIILDSLLTLSNAFPSFTSISGDTIFWNIGSIAPFQLNQIRLFVHVSSLFDPLLSLPSASPVNFNSGIINLSSGNTLNIFSSVDSIRCSFDPNDKHVEPPGIQAAHFTLMSDSLTYMIRFQNTGNDTAFLVVIRDTLNNAFDFSTLEYVSSSHACKINVTHDGAAEFRFENILLPYKAEDESNSNGFVKFRIHVKQGTTDYTVINNKAFIQFDFNYSIETNSTQNTMVYTIPIGIETPPYEWNCKLFPNPMSESATLLFDNKSHDPVLLIIYDISGKKISEMSTYSNSININKKQMSNGIYLWKLINERSLKSMHGKIVVN